MVESLVRKVRLKNALHTSMWSWPYTAAAGGPGTNIHLMSPEQRFMNLHAPIVSLSARPTLRCLICVTAMSPSIHYHRKRRMSKARLSTQKSRPNKFYWFTKRPCILPQTFIPNANKPLIEPMFLCLDKRKTSNVRTEISLLEYRSRYANTYQLI